MFILTTTHISTYRVAHTFEKAAVESVRCLYVRELDTLRLPLCHAHQGRPIGGTLNPNLTGYPTATPNRGAKYRGPAQYPNTDT